MSEKRCRSCNRLVINEEVVLCESCENVIHKECSIKKGNVFYCDLCYTSALEDGNTEHNKIYELPDVIRRSHIDDYKTCPYLAYHIIVKGMSFDSSGFAQVGIDLHELFYLVNIGEITLDELKPRFNEIVAGYSDELFLHDTKIYKDKTAQQQRIDMIEKGFKCIESFKTNQVMFPKKPFEAEKQIIFSIREDLPKVSITMDRIDEYNDKLYITDYKTGAVLTGIKLSSNLQVPLYIYAIQQHYGKTVEEFRLQYLEENKERVYTRVTDNIYKCEVGKRVYPINIQQTIADVTKMFESMKNGEWNIPSDVKKMYFSCKVCSLHAIGGCDGADLQTWKTKDGIGW